MQAVAFLNARHWVQIGDDKGEAHGHTWKVHLEADLPEATRTEPRERDGFCLPFRDLETILQTVLEDLEGRVLNKLPEFAALQPSTENLTRLLAVRIAGALAAHGAWLHSLAVWESPTKAVTVTMHGQDIPVPPGAATRPDVGTSAVAVVSAPAAAAPPHKERGVSSGSETGSLSPPSKGDRGAPSPQLDGLPPRRARRRRRRGARHQRRARPAPPSAPDVLEVRLGPGAAQAAGPDEPLAPLQAARLPGRRRHQGSPARQPAGSGGTPAPDGTFQERPFAPRPGGLPARPSPWYWFLAVALILATTAAVYLPLILAPAAHRYPAGDDAWGHVEKALLLLRGIRAGHWLPAYDPNWYGGYPPFRYWGPAAYYLLAAAIRLVSDPYRGVSLYLAACAAIGGLSWLAYVRRIGAVAALAAGLLWVVWPGNTYVAFATGNLPECLSTALTPLLVLAVLRLFPEARPAAVAGAAALMAVITLVHPGMAAVTVAGCLAFTLCALVLNAATLGSFVRVAGALALGIGGSLWWLLPALQGGPLRLAGVSAVATGGFTPLVDMFNPVLHLREPETVYWGVSTLIAAGIGVATWSAKQAWARAALVAVGVFVLANMPAVSAVYESLPLHGVIWPSRFLGVGGTLLFAGALQFPLRLRPGAHLSGLVAVLGVALVIAADAAYAFPVIRTTAPAPDVNAAVQAMAALPGWREATLDLSRLGSFPTSALAANGTPQVFGWASQGAPDLPLLVDLNTALQKGWYTFLFDRLRLAGATQLLGLSDLTSAPGFAAAAAQAGYHPLAARGDVTAWTSDPVLPAGPYAVAGGTAGLVIGRYAPVWTSLFPQLGRGPSIYVNDYTATELDRFPVVVLSGFRWHSQQTADSVLRSYLSSGGHLVVDLTGAPVGVLSRRPLVFGVYGEPIDISGGMTVDDGRGQLQIGPFPPPYDPWQTYVPQGIDQATVRLDALGMTTPLVGYRTLPEGKVWFLGGNLAFLGYVTHDQGAIGLVGQTIGLSPGAQPVRRYLPLGQFTTSSAGVRFQLVVPQGSPMPVVLPFSFSPGTRLEVAGQAVHPLLVDSLPNLYLAPGRYAVSLTAVAPPGARTGEIVSGAAALVLVAWLTGALARRPARRLIPVAVKGAGAGVV